MGRYTIYKTIKNYTRITNPRKIHTRNKMMIFGLLLLHVSCTTAVNIGFAQKKGGKTGIVLTSSKFKKRYFKVEDNLLGYYKKEASTTPQKRGLPTQAGIYYTTDPNHVTENELIMWSAGLESMAFTDIIAKPQRIGNDWIQHLKFDDKDSLDQWISKLSQVCTVNKTVSEDWAAKQKEALARGWTMEIGVALKKGSSTHNWKPRTFKLKVVKDNPTKGPHWSMIVNCPNCGYTSKEEFSATAIGKYDAQSDKAQFEPIPGVKFDELRNVYEKLPGGHSECCQNINGGRMAQNFGFVMGSPTVFVDGKTHTFDDGK